MRPLGRDTQPLAAVDSAVLPTTAADLVGRAQRGDERAFAQLVEPRIEQLLRLARAILGSDADARDVTQESLLAAWSSLPRLREADRFDPWLHRIVMNRCRDQLRRRDRSREIDLADQELATPDQSTRVVEHAVVLAAFDRLRLGDRELLVLHHVHGYSTRELAATLGIREGTAKSRLHTARRALERFLEVGS
jgi:RNA polymerase sigma-70 factor (ECF subfamily)